MKLVICGKGGSGKSTASALIAREIKARGEKVLVVDTDESNFGLYKQLGLNQPKDFMDSFGGKRGLGEKMRMSRRAEGEKKPNLLDEFAIDDIPSELIVGEDGLKLVAIGKIHDYGEGCACPMGRLAREFIEKLKADGMHVVVDTDAGIEHFGRGVEAGCDKILVVIDPSYESVQLSSKIAEMGAKINKPVFFLLNRMNDDASELRELVDADRIVGALPNDKDVFLACLKGKKVPEIQEIKPVVDRLLSK
jgi:CO dehydrogenase maturation factor